MFLLLQRKTAPHIRDGFSGAPAKNPCLPCLTAGGRQAGNLDHLFATSFLCARQESNLDPGLRRPVFYPLNYRRTRMAWDDYGSTVILVSQAGITYTKMGEAAIPRPGAGKRACRQNRF